MLANFFALAEISKKIGLEFVVGSKSSEFVGLFGLGANEEVLESVDDLVGEASLEWENVGVAREVVDEREKILGSTRLSV